MKVPVPVPSEVFVVSATVGFAVVAQQTPLAVMAPPPSAVIFPPETAVVKPIGLAAVVVRVASATAVVVNVTSLPYETSALLIA